MLENELIRTLARNANRRFGHSFEEDKVEKYFHEFKVVMLKKEIKFKA